MRLVRKSSEIRAVGIAFALTLGLAVFSGLAFAQVDLLVTHARIYTENPSQPWAEAMAVKNGRIAAVGSEAQLASFRAGAAKEEDAHGKLILPGFHDTHIHFMSGSLSLAGINLDDVQTLAEVQRLVKEYAAAHPKAPWIVGRGWSYDLFGETALPDRKMLDAVVADRPVYLEGYDGHTSWVNSKALELAEVTKSTADPANGKIVRDASGDATGALKEAAQEVVSSHIPEPTRSDRLNALRAGLHHASANGLTRVRSAGGDFEYLDLYEQLRKSGELTVRQSIAYFLDPPELTPAALEQIENARRDFHDDWITGGVVKTMLDGVVESHTAAMLTPYSDDPSLSGKMFWDAAKYTAAVTELDKRGFTVMTHAIGEKSVRTALDAYETAAKANGTRGRDHSIEHIETCSEADRPRFGQLHVVAGMQPLHTYPNDDTLKVWAKNAGPDRASRAWSWRTIQAGGGLLAFGSDWPVVTLNPWYGVQTAVTRQTREGKPEGGWIPNERISLEETIAAYTLNAAKAEHRERDEGSLETGKLADFIIVSQDVFRVRPSELSSTKVEKTFVGGRLVYDGAAAPSVAARDHQETMNSHESTTPPDVRKN